MGTGGTTVQVGRAHLHSEDFARLRLASESLPGTVTSRDWVLKRPARAERPTLESIVADAADALEYLAAADIESAANRYNRT